MHTKRQEFFLMRSFSLDLSILCLIFPSEDVILNHFLSMNIVHMAASHHVDNNNNNNNNDDEFNTESTEWLFTCTLKTTFPL